MQNKKDHRVQMMKMITDWRASGLKQKDYCKANKVAYHVFHYWYGLYRANKMDAGSFLPVTITPAVHTEHIPILGVSGLKVQVPLRTT